MKYSYKPQSFLVAFIFLYLAASLLKLDASWTSLSVETRLELVVTCTPLSQAVVWQGNPSRLKGLKAKAFSSDSEIDWVSGASVSELGKSQSLAILSAQRSLSWAPASIIVMYDKGRSI